MVGLIISCFCPSSFDRRCVYLDEKILLTLYLFVGGYLSTQLGGLRLLGARRASLPSPGITPSKEHWHVKVRNLCIHINSKSPGYYLNLPMSNLIFSRFILLQLAYVQVTMRLKAGPTWDNVELSDLVWAIQGRTAGQPRCAGGQLPSTNYSQVSPSPLIRSHPFVYFLVLKKGNRGFADFGRYGVGPLGVGAFGTGTDW